MNHVSEQNGCVIFKNSLMYQYFLKFYLLCLGRIRKEVIFFQYFNKNNSLLEKFQDFMFSSISTVGGGGTA